MGMENPQNPANTPEVPVKTLGYGSMYPPAPALVMGQPVHQPRSPSTQLRLEPIVSSRRSLLLSPFHLQTYAALAYFLVWNLAFVLFAHIWIITWFSLSLGLTVLCCLGLCFLVGQSYIFRAMANLHIWIVKVVCPPNDPSETVLTHPIIPVWERGCLGIVKATLFERLFWKSIGYYTFVGLPWACITWAILLVMFVGSLWFLLYPFYFIFQVNPLANCPDCGMLSSPASVLLTVPVGAIGFWLTCIVTVLLSHAERRIVWFFLGHSTVNRSTFCDYDLTNNAMSINGFHGDEEMKSRNMEEGVKVADVQAHSTAPIPVEIKHPLLPGVRATYARHIEPEQRLTAAFRSGVKGKTMIGCCLVTYVLLVMLLGWGIWAAMLSIRCHHNRKGNGETWNGEMRIAVQPAEPVTLEINADLGVGCWNDMELEFNDHNDWTPTAAEMDFPVNWSATVNYIAPKQSEKAMDHWFVVHKPTDSKPTFKVELKEGLTSSQKILLCPGLKVAFSIPNQYSAANAPTPFNIVVKGGSGLKVHFKFDNPGSSLKYVNKIDGATDNGKIKFDNIGTFETPVPTVSLTTGNSGIKGKTVYATSLTMKTSNSEIEIKEAMGSAAATVETSNSEIEINALDLPKSDCDVSFTTRNSHVEVQRITFSSTFDQKVYVSTSNGKAVVEHLNGFNGNFDVTNSNGKIDLSMCSTVKYDIKTDNHVTGSIGTGQSNIVVKTSNGGVDFGDC